MNILEKIVAQRKKTIAIDRALAQELPERIFPVVPFFTKKPFLICEFKKASPTRGDFQVRSYEALAQDYRKAGVSRFSVLTEREGFKGSLWDLYMLKQKYPQCGFLRKDFLYCTEDIAHAYNAGADALLLIAEVLDDATLTRLIIETHRYGMQVLCEVHSLDSLQRVLALPVLPDALGINARNLETFTMHQDQPLRLKAYIPEYMPVVYESGVTHPYLMELIGNARFSATLIGESVVKSPKRVQLIRAFMHAYTQGFKQNPNFFTQLYKRQQYPLIKVCGLTRSTDVSAVAKLGCDVAGFIFVPESPRCTNESFLKSVKQILILKVAVVRDPDQQLVKQLRTWLKRGLIHAVQFHGNESAELIYSFHGQAYKATTDTSVHILPVTLYDAPKSKDMRTGKNIAQSKQPQVFGQWLAGGLTAQNISAMIKTVRPGLVDINSGIEDAPGIKNSKLLKAVVKEVRHG